jgi:hypothetical protein
LINLFKVISELIFIFIIMKLAERTGQRESEKEEPTLRRSAIHEIIAVDELSLTTTKIVTVTL